MRLQRVFWFLWVLALAGLGLANGGRDVVPHSREAVVMGTRVALTTYADTRAHGLEQLERMLAIIERAEVELSTWKPESHISRLNASAGGAPFRLTAPVCRLLSGVGRYVARTDGAFDPAIGALIAAWDLHGRGRVPSSQELDAARMHSGWGLVALDNDHCTARLSTGVSIDVGAFGKGEALDRVREAMPHAERWLIDLGGQIAVSTVPPGTKAWTVTIAHPFRRSQAVRALAMTGGSLATSGGSERDLPVGATRVGHILDPRTGAPAQFSGSVSVWSERALIADMLSTALYVMGPEEGIRWANVHGVAAMFLWIGPGGSLTASRSCAFSSRFGADPSAAKPRPTSPLSTSGSQAPEPQPPEAPRRQAQASRPAPPQVE